jgi:hypothetical protein
MSRQRQENKKIVYRLIGKFDRDGYPAELPWIMDFLAKVDINGGRVNTNNQQDTLDTLWKRYGENNTPVNPARRLHTMKHGENHVITGNAIVVWDGITKPETMKNGQPMAKPQFSLKLALQPTDSSVAEIDAICKAALQTSEFKGVMPHGGSWPLASANPQIADGALNGMVTINPKTTQQDITQKVYDANGQLLNPLSYARMLYPGAIVQVIVHAFPFNNVQKGIALGLDGIRIIDAAAPALNIGASMPASEVATAFGAPVAPGMFAGQPGMAPGQPSGYQPPVAPGAPGQYVPPQQQYAAPPVQPPMPPITPAPDFLQPQTPPLPPAHQMLPAAQGATFEQLVAVGWTEATLRQHGMMV